MNDESPTVLRRTRNRRDVDRTSKSTLDPRGRDDAHRGSVTTQRITDEWVRTSLPLAVLRYARRSHARRLNIRDVVDEGSTNV
jgi:hypothetical protein